MSTPSQQSTGGQMSAQLEPAAYWFRSMAASQWTTTRWASRSSSCSAPIHEREIETFLPEAPHPVGGPRGQARCLRAGDESIVGRPHNAVRWALKSPRALVERAGLARSSRARIDSPVSEARAQRKLSGFVSTDGLPCLRSEENLTASPMRKIAHFYSPWPTLTTTPP